MSEFSAASSAERPAWLQHFARVSGASGFTASALAGGEPAEPSIAEPAEAEPPAESNEPTIDADLLAQAFEEGRRSAQLEFAEDKAALGALGQSLEALRPEPPEPLAAVLAEAVDRLVRDIAGSTAIDADLLADRAARAAALITEELAPSVLFVHPDDLHLLASETLAVELAGDPSLARGSVKLETATGWTEDGPAVRLERLRLALDRMGSPE